MKHPKTETYRATQNACKLCAPLGASLAFKGIRGAIPLLHGSQGCSTYIRRYLISHYREPVDIACSNFSEQTAIFGGRANLETAIDNIRRQYAPEMIGIATTCLSETIGDDVPGFLKDFAGHHPDMVPLVHVVTPSYSGTHVDGFHGAVRATVAALNPFPLSVSPGSLPPDPGMRQVNVRFQKWCNLFPGMASPADLRHLKEIMADFGMTPIVLPDYSDTLDGPIWSEYRKIPEGGTPVHTISAMHMAGASLEFGHILSGQPSAGKDLLQRFGVPYHPMGIPVGIDGADRFLQTMSQISGRPAPKKYEDERGRLIDAYADGHKYVSRIRAVIFGEEDLVCAMAGFLDEIGVIPVLCASGGNSGRLETHLADIISNFSKKEICVMENADFTDIEEKAAALHPDILIGSSKGYSISKKLGAPLVRVGFPVHDRFGGARLLHVGYRGTQQLFDRIVNTIIEARQAGSKVGYAYM